MKVTEEVLDKLKKDLVDEKAAYLIFTREDDRHCGLKLVYSSSTPDLVRKFAETAQGLIIGSIAACNQMTDDKLAAVATQTVQ